MTASRPRPSLDGPYPRAQSYAGYSSTLHPLEAPSSSSQSSSRGTESAQTQRPQTLWLHSTQQDRTGRVKLMRSVSAIGPASLTLSNAMENETMTWRARAQGDTPLDKTINSIGMGRYQWALLVLTGCGYAADNAWLQGVAIILPRVQKDFQVSDSHIGLLSSCTFAGMMVGAFAWGTWSDSNGRKLAFDGTLLLVTIFGFLSAFAASFPTLCAGLFCLGLGLGGSMPTDGLVFVENLPTSKQYLLTFLSVFFSMGSVASSTLGLLLIPGDLSRWRWFMGSLAALTTFFLVLRLVFFRLIESPRYLASSGRFEEARMALQRIAAFNGSPLPVSLSDVHDARDPQDRQSQGAVHNSSPLKTTGGYSALATGDAPESPQSADGSDEGQENEYSQGSVQGLSFPERIPDWLPSRLAVSLAPLLAKYSILFNDHWRLTTALVWGIWTTVSLAYTMFNVFLPKFLESRLSTPTEPSEPGAVMRDYLLYSIASLPGSLLGAWLVETRLGRRGTMALSLALTTLGMLAFIRAGQRWLIIASSMAISLTVTIAYAALYGYTPEVFQTDVRGTASGTASALSRLAGIIAPVLAGWLFSLSLELPLMLSVVLFLSAAAMCIALPMETRRPRTLTDGGREGGDVG